jgi:uncharacterized protein with von Willebrand factor type A (vWA) domain
LDYRYSYLDPSLRERGQRLARLRALFEHLLLQANGDAEEALRWIERLGKRYRLFGEDLTLEDFRRWLEQQKLVLAASDGALKLTHAGERGLFRGSFELLFAHLKGGLAGDHRAPGPGAGHERMAETRPWVFGDPLASLAPAETLCNAVRRGGLEGFAIAEADLEVYETERLSSCATVLLIDVSHSMILYGEDRITPAKRVALALAELVTTRYPKDALKVVLFGDEAWEVPLGQIPYCGVGPYHTNTRAGLRLARELLRKERQAERQILMITDGKPSALTEPDGSLYKNPFGLDPRIVNKTLEEAEQCRRLAIPITTFMLTDDALLVGFVEELTRTNRGRAFYAQPERLGDFVLVDYLRNRRRR